LLTCHLSGTGKGRAAFERHSLIKLLGLFLDVFGHRFLTEAGYMSIEIDDVPEKNWITAIAKKE